MPVVAVMRPCLLLLMEPDFGATAILLGVVFLMLFLGGARVHYYLAFLVFAAGGLVMIAVAAPYRVKRLLNFMDPWRSEAHTSELQSLMRISYAVFCLKIKKYNTPQ